METATRTRAAAGLTAATQAAAPAAERPGAAVRPLPRRVPRIAVVVGCCVLAVLIALGVSLAAGVRLFVVESPSMGEAAPIGTLVVGVPVGSLSDLRVGDVVTYRPPGPGSSTSTHRIVREVPAGVRTRGDINAAEDPWTVRLPMIETCAVALVPGVGWLFRLGPVIASGAAVVWIVAGLIRNPAWRSSVRVVGSSLVVAVTVAVHRPLTGSLLLSASSEQDGLRVTVVSTGLLPIHVQAVGGRSLDLVAGAMGTLLLPADDDGQVRMAFSPHLDLVGWCVLTLLCLIPTIWTLLCFRPRGQVVAGVTAEAGGGVP